MSKSSHAITENNTSDLDRRPTLAFGVLLTVVAWFIVRLTVGAAWALARYPFAFRPYLWFRWDSNNYFSIALHGTTFSRCEGSARALGIHWCGTSAWLPGYPWLVRALSYTGFSLLNGGLLISWLATVAAIFLVWLGWGRDLSTERALALLLLFGLFPGAVYNFAFFPTSLALACVVGAVLAATRKRFLVAAALMIAGGLCYPSEWYAAVGLAIGLALGAIPLGATAVVRRALWGIAGLASVLVVVYYDQLSTGHANAFFRLQAQVRVAGSSFHAFVSLIFKRDSVDQTRIGRFYGAVLAFQAIVAIFLSGSAVAIAIAAWRRKERDAAILYPALIGVAVVLGTLLLPSTGSWNRSVVLAAPCVVLLRRIPLPALCVILGIVGATTVIMSRAFFIGNLI